MEHLDINLWEKQADALKTLSPVIYNDIYSTEDGENFDTVDSVSEDSPIEVVGYGGAKGGGKSYLSRAWQVLRRIYYPGSRGLLIRESFPELERTHILQLKRELPQHLYNYVERRHTFDFVNGSSLELAYVERAEDVETRYWGAEYDDIAIDEAQNHSKEVFRLLRACLRTTRTDLKVRMLLAFNWGGIGHSWLFKMFWRKHMSVNATEYDKEDVWENPEHWEEGEKPEHFAFIQARVYDNPSIMENDPGYIDRLMAFPKEVRDSYLEGEPMGLEGQFYKEFGPHLSEEPFEIEESDLNGNLYGSLDSGTTHATVFNLWWLAGPHFEEKFGRPWTIHLLFTYEATGGTIQDHAREIYTRISGFPFIKGHWPEEIVYDGSMDTKHKLSQVNVRSAIDEYKDVFAGKHTRFVPDDRDKVNGCQIVRMVMAGGREYPALRYWRRFNVSFEHGIARVIFDKNNREIYAKMDGDDLADCSRYGIKYLWAVIGGRKDQHDHLGKFREYNMRQQQKSWKEL